ncbi:hypothetical protein GH714_022992 [Hevea brasiliensis]|uniref:Terpene synthase metal-binding domain-containing protein n=1 Tax=Hevea brasiliensis TaxID=3981 RepID=A0A6A6LA29_HEVBR|nr:hypothetical protein GH714_022992 [Hevea brasiliensis]
MLMQSREKLADKIEFINLLCRLGVSYNFENEIEEQLNDIFIVLPDLLSKNDYDLYTLAILFQVLRQYGYKMPCVAAHFEPEYTLARLMITKYTKMLSVVDDTYDAYGTIDELRRFTDAFQRCNADAIDEVPEYMKVIYKGLLNLFDENRKCWQ